jgi:pimeloyl-ACP methyl ester carboxylesterase
LRRPDWSGSPGCYAAYRVGPIEPTGLFCERNPCEVRESLAQSQQFLADARELDRQQCARCVDFYYRAALRSAKILDAETCGGAGCRSTWLVYHSSLGGLIEAGQRYGRLDPRCQLVVDERRGRAIPVVHHGFAWRPSDFSRLVSSSRFQSRQIAHRFGDCGIGHALVGERVACCQEELFFRPRQPFAVTAVLRPLGECDGDAPESVLELYNPHTTATIAWRTSAVDLARDLTGPMAAIVREAPRQYLRGFTAPSDTSVQPQLVLVEPYQPGKIPVIFVHGLYSDPITWVDTVNELRAVPGLYERFQFWMFRYPTGGELLESAAVLRQRLILARELFDPQHCDPALDEMVLIGHSLGGLVCMLQVTESGDALWREIARRPFCDLCAPPDVLARLAQRLFYEPVPFVTRTILIGTPHSGSKMTRRLAGRVGRKLVRFDSAADRQYEDMLEANRQVFYPDVVAAGRPTTIDLLEPSSPLLAGLKQMPINPAVHLHSIIGTGGCDFLHQPGDGIVTVESARKPGVDSELYVPVRHEKLHRDERSIAEMVRILRLHLADAHCRSGLALREPRVQQD